MKKIIILFLCLILTMGSITTLSSCSKDSDFGNNSADLTNEQLIENRIKEFLTAYNGGDMDAVLNCLDSKSRNAMSAMLNLLGGLAGSQIGFDIDLRDLFSLGIYIESDDFMKLQIIDITATDSKNAIATTTMDLTGAGVQTIYFYMVYENDSWYISDMTDKKGGVSNENNSDTAINITEFYSSNRVVFTIDNKEYAGVVNSNGEIFYYIEDDYISWTSVGDGVGYISHTKNDETIYDIVNQDGTVVASFKEKVDFDKIVGYGEGTILVYKNTSDISKVEYSYGVIDCNQGTWLSPLKPYEKYISVDGYGESLLQCIGNGIFLDVYYSRNTNHCIIYNGNISQIIELSDITGAIFGQDGVIYGVGEQPWYSAYIYRNGEWTDESLPPYFTMDANGNVTEIETFVKYENDIMIKKDSTEEYYSIHNLNTHTSVIYDDFKIDSIVGVEIVDDNVLFTIKGADGKYYFVLVDESGNACFEPIAVEYSMGWTSSSAYVTVSENEIIYRAAGSEYYTMIDLQGNVIVSEDKEYSSMYFGEDNNLIYAKKSDDEESLLDRAGKAIVITLKTK